MMTLIIILYNSENCLKIVLLLYGPLAIDSVFFPFFVCRRRVVSMVLHHLAIIVVDGK